MQTFMWINYLRSVPQMALKSVAIEKNIFKVLSMLLTKFKIILWICFHKKLQSLTLKSNEITYKAWLTVLMSLKCLVYRVQWFYTEIFIPVLAKDFDIFAYNSIEKKKDITSEKRLQRLIKIWHVMYLLVICDRITKHLLCISK